MQDEITKFNLVFDVKSIITGVVLALLIGMSLISGLPMAGALQMILTLVGIGAFLGFALGSMPSPADSALTGILLAWIMQLTIFSTTQLLSDTLGNFLLIWAFLGGIAGIVVRGIVDYVVEYIDK